MNYFGKLSDILRSAKLALVLLMAILASCVVGVVFLPPETGRAAVFSSLWFNGILVLLVVNVIFCFFRGIRCRKIDPAFAGMIVFHLSFALLFLGIVYDSLFYFQGAMRLTEGETLSRGMPANYEWSEWGRFFDHAKLTGDVTLNRLHRQYVVDGNIKGVANELVVGEGSDITKGVAYTTKALRHKAFDFYRDRDGYSPLIILWDEQGREIYGAYSPLLSLKQKDGGELHTTGTPTGAGSISFPQDPALSPLFDLQIAYYPSPMKERAGEVSFEARQKNTGHSASGFERIYKGRGVLGQKVKVGEYYLSLAEVRYWANVKVYYNPGLPMILTSFWIGLGGLIITTVARLKKD